jgi:aspartyl protease family protein
MRSLAALAFGLWALAGAAQAQSVTLSGMLGGKALLVVDGGRPMALAPGEARQGVKVLSTAGQQAVVEVSGQRLNLRVGDAPASVSAGASDGGKIVLTADTNGHFFSGGQINGKSVQFIVDTGASVVSLGAAEAERVGLNYKGGQLVHMGTANGESVGWRVKLSSVRVGPVTLTEVDAVVTPVAMPYVLLGNSFLTRFQMTRTNDQMVLARRY